MFTFLILSSLSVSRDHLLPDANRKRKVSSSENNLKKKVRREASEVAQMIDDFSDDYTDAHHSTDKELIVEILFDIVDNLTDCTDENIQIEHEMQSNDRNLSKSQPIKCDISNNLHISNCPHMLNLSSLASKELSETAKVSCNGLNLQLRQMSEKERCMWLFKNKKSIANTLSLICNSSQDALNYCIQNANEFEDDVIESLIDLVRRKETITSFVSDKGQSLIKLVDNEPLKSVSTILNSSYCHFCSESVSFISLNEFYSHYMTHKTRNDDVNFIPNLSAQHFIQIDVSNHEAFLKGIRLLSKQPSITTFLCCPKEINCQVLPIIDHFKTQASGHVRLKIDSKKENKFLLFCKYCHEPTQQPNEHLGTKCKSHNLSNFKSKPICNICCHPCKPNILINHTLSHFSLTSKDEFLTKIRHVYQKLIIQSTTHQVTTLKHDKTCMICHAEFKTSLSNHLNVTHRIDFTRQLHYKFVLFYLLDASSPYCQIYSTITKNKLYEYKTAKDFWTSDLFSQHGISFWESDV